MTLWWALPATVIVLRYKNQTLLVFFLFVNNQVKLYQNILCLTIIKVFDDIYNLALWLLTLLAVWYSEKRYEFSQETTVVKRFFCLPARMEMLGWRCVAKRLAKLQQMWVRRSTLSPFQTNVKLMYIKDHTHYKSPWGNYSFDLVLYKYNLSK